MPRIHPRTWEDGIMPLSEFPDYKQAEIAEAVAQPFPPEKWLRFTGAQIESRAWYEWHWTRGRKWRHVGDGPIGRRSLPRRVRLAVIERDGLICGLCGGDVEPTDVHIDHIYPVALGGGDDLKNLQVAHSLCNIRKGARV